MTDVWLYCLFAHSGGPGLEETHAKNTGALEKRLTRAQLARSVGLAPLNLGLVSSNPTLGREMT